MKRPFCLGLALLFLLVACSSNAPTTPIVPTMTSPPTLPPPTATSTLVLPAPAPTDTATLTATETLQPTNTPTVIPAASPLRPTATSSGPLSANVYVANCRSAPTPDKPGRVLVQISIDASGGNGTYRYFYQDQEYPTKFIELTGEKGRPIIGEVRITSGDGLTLTQPFDFYFSDRHSRHPNCP